MSRILSRRAIAGVVAIPALSRATSAAPVPPAGRILAMTRVLDALWAEHARFDRASTAAGLSSEDGRRLEAQRDALLLRMQELQKTVEATPPVTLADAAALVMAAHGRAALIAGSSLTEAELLEDLALVRGSLRAALPILAEAAGVTLAAIGGNYHGVAGTDPWLAVTP
ncbi:hypothetical protein M0638_07105 [Roseomonas sp. NAR14]|uniref:Uncharacterized protein n=1 Tax=Roseomonas acroporae TaxID=2937791 RepID=A0A9X1Y631_9PROT|nr:hypothetical protein [Roseomonas acroporae]MCK8784143.1 hypothetical protein [Roseomonas acroporae]